MDFKNNIYSDIKQKSTPFFFKIKQVTVSVTLNVKFTGNFRYQKYIKNILRQQIIGGEILLV